MSEDEQLAMALSLSLQDEDNSGFVNSGFVPPGGAVAAAEVGGAGGDAGGGMRARVAGAQVIEDRTPYVVYLLEVDGFGGGAPPSRQRFSSFEKLLNAIGRELGGGGGGRIGPSTAATEMIDKWKRQMTMEKRHTGKASRSESIVRARCALLQKMLDELLALSDTAHSMSMLAFLSGEMPRD
jgi:hypothetical protein